METSLFPDYILDITSDNDTPNGDNGINNNDDDDDENYINDNNVDNDRNQYNDHIDDDNDKNYDNNNGEKTIMILQAIQFGEPCKKAEFCECAQILMCLYSTNLCLIYRGELRFLKNHRSGRSRSLCKICKIDGGQ